MGLTREQMCNKFKQQCKKIELMFNNGTPDKAIFEELCCSIYAGDEYAHTEGIINNDKIALIELLCEYIITDYATASMLDCQKISFPDHSEIIATICLQLKRDDVLLNSVIDRLRIKDQDNYDWFASNGNECSQVISGLKEVWDNA